MIQTKIFESSMSAAPSTSTKRSSPSFNQIQISSSTGLSLNDRFTAISGHAAGKANELSGGGSILKRRVARSRSVSGEHGRMMDTLPPVNRFMTMANQRLLEQLQRKHTMQAALKLKRVRYFHEYSRNVLHFLRNLCLPRSLHPLL